MNYFEKAAEEIVANFLFRISPAGKLISTLNPIEVHLSTYVKIACCDKLPIETYSSRLKDVAKGYLINAVKWTEADAEKFCEMQANDKLSTTPVHIVLNNVSVSIRAEIDMDGFAPAHLTKSIEKLQYWGIKIPDVLEGTLTLLNSLTSEYNALLEFDIGFYFQVDKPADAISEPHKAALSRFLCTCDVFRRITKLSCEDTLALIKNQSLDTQ